MPRVYKLVKCISTLDLIKGYWQVLFSPKARSALHLCFSTSWTLSFRPTGPVWLHTWRIFVIDSPTWLDHLHCLQEVLSERRKVVLTANPLECHPGLTEAQFLGYCIGRRLLKPQERAVCGLPSTCHQEACMCPPSILCLTSFYPDTIHWTPATESAFQDLRSPLTSSLILRNLNFQLRPFWSTHHPRSPATPEFDGDKHPVIYISWKVCSAEKQSQIR